MRFVHSFRFAALACLILAIAPTASLAALKVGAFAQDITPTEFPVVVNGGFTARMATSVHDPLHARAFVFDDGQKKLAIVVVDSCMIPREVLDKAKDKAQALTGIPAQNMLIAATHTHSAPSAGGALGTDADPKYPSILPDLLAKAIQSAHQRLAPAKIAATNVFDYDHAACRRYIWRPERMRTDPFGELTIRANMHPGYNNPDQMGPTGPIDPGLSILSIQHADGRPLGLISNYSMHYYTAPPLSADYFGIVCRNISAGIKADPDFVPAHSQGTSGDIYLADYMRPEPKPRRDIEQFSAQISDNILAAMKNLSYRADLTIDMKEQKVSIRRRTPDEKRLAWARETMKTIKDQPKTQPQVYAREAIYLHEEPVRELRIQAIRIGDIGITGIPNEVFALTGLKIKSQSPLPVTFNMSLANGTEGYIPPPEQHKLGGYTTWPARSAGLVPQAEPLIAQTVLSLLESVSGKKAKPYAELTGPYAKMILAAKPSAYYRMGEMAGPRCIDATGNGCDGVYEDGVVFALDGPQTPAFTGYAKPKVDLSTPAQAAALPPPPPVLPDASSDHNPSFHPINRCAHFAGGRLKLPAPTGSAYTIEFFFWNALGHDARPITAYLFSRGQSNDPASPGEHLAIAGTADPATKGKLLLHTGATADKALAGKTILTPRTWYHVALVRDGAKVIVYLNGQQEITGELPASSATTTAFLAGRHDPGPTLEGKLDETALYPRALTAEEVLAHVKAAALE